MFTCMIVIIQKREIYSLSNTNVSWIRWRGLDLPDVALVAILDADKEGCLRSEGSLIQTIGRAARNLNGRAILYADHMTDSMRQAIGETSRRRAKQEAYNREHNITPQSITRSVDMQLARIVEADYITVPADEVPIGDINSEQDLQNAVAQLELQMREAAKNFEFEKAASLRDKIRALKQRDLGEIFAPAENGAEAANESTGAGLAASEPTAALTAASTNTIDVMVGSGMLCPGGIRRGSIAETPAARPTPSSAPMTQGHAASQNTSPTTVPSE